MPQTASSTIHFQAKLNRPSGADKDASWTFLNLPQVASDQLPARSMVSVEGKFNGVPFQTTLLPDGQGGHWLKLEEKQRQALGAKAGEVVTLEVAPATVEPEPEVPEDLQQALANGPQKARETWAATTALARRDWIFWIVSGKLAETRVKRIEVAIDKLASGKRRACCFDRAGIASKSLSCPVAADETN